MNQQRSLAISFAKEAMFELQGLQIDLENIQSDISHCKERLTNLLTEHLKGIAAERVREEASSIYWLSSMQDFSSVIEEAYSKATGQPFFPVPSSLPLRLWCYVCGNGYGRLIRTWADIAEIDKNRHKCRGMLEDGADIRHLFSDIACPDCVSSHARKTHTDRIKYDQEIQRLRDIPYAEYLRSEHWQRVRRRELQAANYRCRLCNKNVPLQVHHRTYERRGNEMWNDVIALCRLCHEKFHDIVPQKTDQ